MTGAHDSETTGGASSRVRNSGASTLDILPREHRKWSRLPSACRRSAPVRRRARATLASLPVWPTPLKWHSREPAQLLPIYSSDYAALMGTGADLIRHGGGGAPFVKGRAPLGWKQDSLEERLRRQEGVAPSEWTESSPGRSLAPPLPVRGLRIELREGVDVSRAGGPSYHGTIATTVDPLQPGDRVHFIQFTWTAVYVYTRRDDSGWLRQLHYRPHGLSRSARDESGGSNRRWRLTIPADGAPSARGVDAHDPVWELDVLFGATSPYYDQESVSATTFHSPTAGSTFALTIYDKPLGTPATVGAFAATFARSALAVRTIAYCQVHQYLVATALPSGATSAIHHVIARSEYQAIATFVNRGRPFRAEAESRDDYLQYLRSSQAVTLDEYRVERPHVRETHMLPSSVERSRRVSLSSDEVCLARMLGRGASAAAMVSCAVTLLSCTTPPIELPSHVVDVREPIHCERHCGAVGIWAEVYAAELLDRRTWLRMPLLVFYFSGDAMVVYHPDMAVSLPTPTDLDLDFYACRTRWHGNVLQCELDPGRWTDMVYFDPEQQVLYQTTEGGSRQDYRRIQSLRTSPRPARLLAIYNEIGVPPRGSGLVHPPVDRSPHRRKR